MDKSDLVLGGLVGVLFAISFAVFMSVGIVFSGWAFMILWGWFMVPLFGLPPLGLAGAIGVDMTVGFVTNQYVPSKKMEDGERDWTPIIYIFSKPVFALLIGYIVKQYL